MALCGGGVVLGRPHDALERPARAQARLRPHGQRPEPSERLRPSAVHAGDSRAPRRHAIVDSRRRKVDAVGMRNFFTAAVVLAGLTNRAAARGGAGLAPHRDRRRKLQLHRLVPVQLRRRAEPQPVRGQPADRDQVGPLRGRRPRGRLVPRHLHDAQLVEDLRQRQGDRQQMAAVEALLPIAFAGFHRGMLSFTKAPITMDITEKRVTLLRTGVVGRHGSDERLRRQAGARS